MSKIYKSKGGLLSPESYVIDKNCFPFDSETSKMVTVKEARYEYHQTRSNLPPAGAKNYELLWIVDPQIDGSMMDLHNSYYLFKIDVPDKARTYGLSQFAVDQMIKDMKIYYGSRNVEDSHNLGMYQYSAFIKDILLRETPAILSATSTPTLDSVLEGNYLSDPLTTLLNGNAGAANPAAAYTKKYMNDSYIYIKVFPKDSIFMTRKYFPSSQKIEMRLIITLDDLLVQDTDSTDAANLQTLTLVDANFYVKRIYLNDSALSAQSATLTKRDYSYILPYSRILHYNWLTGRSVYDINQLFSSGFKPEVLCVFVPLTTVNTGITNVQYPRMACGNYGDVPANAAYGGVAQTAGWIKDAYCTINGHRFPEESAPKGFLSSGETTAYDQYLKACLNPEKPYLSFLHWSNHYSVIVINLRKDGMPWFNQAPDPVNSGCNLHLEGNVGAGGCELYVVALNNAQLNISADGNVNFIN